MPDNKDKITDKIKKTSASDTDKSQLSKAVEHIIKTNEKMKKIDKDKDCKKSQTASETPNKDDTGVNKRKSTIHTSDDKQPVNARKTDDKGTLFKVKKDSTNSESADSKKATEPPKPSQTKAKEKPDTSNEQRKKNDKQKKDLILHEKSKTGTKTDKTKKKENHERKNEIKSDKKETKNDKHRKNSSDRKGGLIFDRILRKLFSNIRKKKDKTPSHIHPSKDRKKEEEQKKEQSSNTKENTSVSETYEKVSSITYDEFGEKKELSGEEIRNLMIGKVACMVFLTIITGIILVFSFLETRVPYINVVNLRGRPADEAVKVLESKGMRDYAIQVHSNINEGEIKKKDYYKYTVIDTIPNKETKQDEGVDLIVRENE